MISKWTINMVKEMGWTVECESPIELRHEDGSFASGQAAYVMLNEIHQDWSRLQEENKDKADEEEIRLALAMYRDLDAHIK
jgi:hypothetical protein